MLKSRSQIGEVKVMAQSPVVPQWKLRAEFAIRLARLYGDEVPAYNTLVEVSREVNEDYVREHGADAERLGSIDRVTAERHGAIRVGSARELAQVARVFGGFGMHPVGFYDLREAAKSAVPVVSTAFRPTDPDELAKNPFRVFTSMLAHDDRRFFDAGLQARLEAFMDARELFPSELLTLADRSIADGGLSEADATRFLDLATASFELSSEPIDHEWYTLLEQISSVASDIGGVPSTHINHLTPRVLDIDDLYQRMTDRGITMIDEIQGPPGWEGPDVLLRQTSFRALDERRQFRYADGTVGEGTLRVRFGEVEQRGIALTRTGRALYDRMVDEVARRRREEQPDRTRVAIAQDVWRESLPDTELGLAIAGLGFFTYRRGDADLPTGDELSLRQLLEIGAVIADPIVYEDFLPASAAGIFQSNLRGEGTRDDEQHGTPWDMARLSEVVGFPIADPTALYERQQQASLDALSADLGVRIVADVETSPVA